MSSHSYDKVYVINLDSSKDRWTKVSANLESAGIEFVRFPAINGRNIHIKDINSGELKTGQEYLQAKQRTTNGIEYNIKCSPEDFNSVEFNIKTARIGFVPGELGTWCSHVSIWREALKKDYQIIVVFEDDIKFKKPSEFREKLDNFINSLPSGFDLAFIDITIENNKLDSYQNSKLVSKPQKNFWGWGAWAIVISKSGIEKLLSFGYYNDPIDFVILKNTKGASENGILETYISAIDLIDVVGASDVVRY